MTGPGRMYVIGLGYRVNGLSSMYTCKIRRSPEQSALACCQASRCHSQPTLRSGLELMVTALGCPDSVEGNLGRQATRYNDDGSGISAWL